MVDQKISQIPQLTTTPVDTDEMHITNAGVSKATTYENLQSGFKSIPKNAVMNANFDIAQRGTSFIGVGGNGKTLDRWIGNDGDGTGDISRQSFTVGQTDVPGEPTFYLRWEQTGDTTSSQATLLQRIESVRTYAGQNVVLSFWAKEATGSATLVPQLVQDFGTGGSTTVLISMTPTNTVLTATWTKYVFTATVPSISGKTIAGGDDNLRLRFRWPLASGLFTHDFAQIQLELGTVATTFETVPIWTELARCQRYFVKTFNNGVVPADNPVQTANGAAYGMGTSNGNFLIQWRFPTRMRGSPTITLYNPGTGTAGEARNYADSTTTAVTTAGVGNSSANILPVTPDATDANDRIAIHATADAEF